MASSTVQERLNIGSPSDIADRMRQLPVGDVFASLIPAERTLTGLASSATQVHDVAGAILQVAVGADQKVIVTSADTPAAGEVGVSYDSDGVATLLFGDGVQTGYTVIAMGLPAGLGTILASEA